MTLFNKIKTFFKVTNYFRPYFNNKVRSFRSLEKVNSDIDDDIVEIYEEISKLPDNKYKNVVIKIDIQQG